MAKFSVELAGENEGVDYKVIDAFLFVGWARGFKWL